MGGRHGLYTADGRLLKMEMDWGALPNNLAITSFVQECEFRGMHDGKPVCGKVAEHAAMSYWIDVRICAQCRLHGPVDENYVRGMSFGVLMTRMADAVKGIHKGPAYIADVASRALQLCSADKRDKRELLEIHLVNLISLSRLGIEDVKEIVRKHGDYPPSHPFHDKLRTAHETRKHIDMNVQKCCGDKEPAVLEEKQRRAELKRRGLTEKAKTIWNDVVATTTAMSKAVQNVSRYAFGGWAEESEIEKRKKICAGCPLFKAGDESRGPTCGIPFTEKMVRDEAVEGCGCFLALKWTGKDEDCPLGHW